MEGKADKFLHGTLEATIFEATTNTPSSTFRCLSFRENPAYVTIKLDKTKVAETNHHCDRVWNQTFRILCAHSSDATLAITLRTRCSVLGVIHIPCHKIMDHAEANDGAFPLLTEKGKLNSKTKLRFILRFTHIEFEPYWGGGLAHEKFPAIKGATFRQRSNCSVTLYQDAHHSSSFQPPVYGHGRQIYRPRRLWEDVYRAIDGAKHLIYIAGWSFNPTMVLVRDPQTGLQHAKGVQIGKLLKQKAEEGVAVRIMLWDDETSLPIIKNKGLMRTHDEDAFDYFKHTKVVCRLCPRLHHKFPTVFAHHQKTITVDAQPTHLPTNISTSTSSVYSREIMSFIGGLDLCDGRYDTEEHSLFRTLNTEAHCNDFYQTNIAGASLHRGGPREPWHDAHACVRGGAAWDVLTNFEQRWTTQFGPSLLLSTPTIPHMLQANPHVDRSDSWKVQVFRSIDWISASSLKDNVAVERSIHEAYVQSIRHAERFIYIENQYFIGGCHLWDKEQHCGCKNLIPVEIALKVASKIKAKEEFAVYIVIPMWPEGVPESESVQDILYWTRQTMSMMYRLIGEAIRETGAEVDPLDYLNFFCLANREEKGRGELVPPSSPRHKTHYWNSQNHRRFMVYVHSKIMIVDDEYILIGSANVNQRSMDGRRDTEIAMGCYQPKYVSSNTSGGDIQAYRMSLWYEHTGRVEELFLEPQNVQCVRIIRAIGEEMWSIYSGDEVIEMEGVHLVKYPVCISKDSTVEDLVTGGGFFPDTTSLIKGKRSKLLPPICTA